MYLGLKILLMKTTSLIFFVFLVYNLSAQNEEVLNGNFVSATISDGPVFFKTSNGTPGYEIPSGSGNGTIFAASIWAGGQDINGQVHLSAARYISDGWSSGPIADPMYYSSLTYTNTYGSSIWKITRQEVLDHLAQYQQGGYIPIAAIADWPGNGDVSIGVEDQLAPFVDMDGDGLYEPYQGDHPDFIGDEAVYVILNDASNPVGNYLGAEVHMLFYHFNNNGYMGETTFLNTRIFNRSTTDYYNFRQSIYVSFNVSGVNYDYIGCDSIRNMMYGYSADNMSFGQPPACQAVMSLNRPMVASTYFTNGAVFPTTDPNSDWEYWNLMNGNWADGSPMYYGGNAYNAGVTTTPTNFTFTGNPFTGAGWHEGNANGGSPNPGEARKGHLTIEHGTFPAGTMVCSDFAFIYDDDDGNLENVQNVKYIADALQILYDSSSDFPCGYLLADTPELDPLEFNVFPNPSSGSFSLQLSNVFDPVIAEVRDVTGRLMYSKITQDELTQIQLDAPAGVYQVSVQSAHSRVTKSIIVQ
jgi:hypothetical protein